MCFHNNVRAQFWNRLDEQKTQFIIYYHSEDTRSFGRKRFFYFSHASKLSGWQRWLMCWSTSLVQIEVSQQLLNCHSIRADIHRPQTVISIDFGDLNVSSSATVRFKVHYFDDH